MNKENSPQNTNKQEAKRAKAIRITQHILAGILLYLMFNFSLFLGLQVNPTYGNIGVLLTVTLLALYIFRAGRKK